MKKPELLAPAGNMDSLHAAIQGGCDAVYLSGTLYGARSFANNFTNEELKEAITYAHLYGVKVYVTINTLIYESEIKNFLSYVDYLVSIFVDAVIVQDIGMMDLLKTIYPSLEIHASTQMHIHNLEGVKLLEQLGIKRVVLARETPLELVSSIKKNSNIELEIFVHGALCVCYSGQCLMSSLIGGRSGNRGTCAQCCRQPYELYTDGKKQNRDQYLLSTKDLNTLSHVPELMDANVDSLKIEGRMKRPEYVYFITSLYRKAIDSYANNRKVGITKEEMEDMKKLFHRGFTKGFLFHEENDSFTNEYRPNHMGIPVGIVKLKKNGFLTIELTGQLSVGDGIRIIGTKEDFGKEVDVIWLGREKVSLAKKGDRIRIPFKENVPLDALVVKTTDRHQLSTLREKIVSKERKVPLLFSFQAKVGLPMTLEVRDGHFSCTVESDFIVEKSKNSPLTEEKIKYQLEKLGGTIYSLEKIELDCDENIFLPIQKINELRRLGIETISQKRLERIPMERKEYSKEVPDFPLTQEKSVYVTTMEEYEKVKTKEYQEIYVDEDIVNQISDERVTLKIPRVQEYLKDSSNRVLVGELGSVFKYQNPVSDFSLNVVNSYSIAFLHSLGVRKVTLSYELNDYQIEKIIQNYKSRYHKNPCLEVIISGKIEAMVTKYNILRKYHLENKDSFLVDKYHNKYPLIEKNNLLYIYHYQNKEVEHSEKYYDMGITSIRDSF